MAQHSKGRSVPQRRTLRPLWLSLGLLAIVLIGGGAWALTGRDAAALIPAYTTHDFGTVPMHNGEVTTKFPLTVREPATITDVNSS